MLRPYNTKDDWMLRLILSVLLVVSLILFAITKSNAANCGRIHSLAQLHSNDMLRRHSLDHDGFYSRANYGSRAENVALASTKAEAMELWRKSPPHAANMLLPGCHEVAHAGRYWTMEIGE